MGWGKKWEATAPIQSLVKLQPWFLRLWTTCLPQNCSLGSSACRILWWWWWWWWWWWYIYIIRVSTQGCHSLQAHEPRLQFYKGLSRFGSFPLIFAPHSLFSIWTDLKRSENIPVAPTRRCGEWIWLTGPSGLHRNSPQGLNISSIRVFDQIRDPEIPITLRPPSKLYYSKKKKQRTKLLHIFSLCLSIFAEKQDL